MAERGAQPGLPARVFAFARLVLGQREARSPDWRWPARGPKRQNRARSEIVRGNLQKSYLINGRS